MGKIPVLHDSIGNRVVAETSIIIEYLQQRYAAPVQLMPSEAEQQLDVRLWDRFFDLYVSVRMQKIVGDRIRPEHAADPHGVAEAHATLTACDMIEGELEGRSWITGERFTMADCSALPALFFGFIVHPVGEGRQRTL